MRRDCAFHQPWYHGSPRRLEALAAGSTITQDRELARVLSHRPAVVLVIKGQGRELKHNGRFAEGFLYRLVGPLGPDDIRTPESSALDPGEEWITVRELKLELDGPTEIVDSELITKGGLKKLLDEGGIGPETYRSIMENQALPD